MYEEDLDYTPDLQLDSDESMEWTVDDDPVLKGIAPEKEETSSSPLRLTFMLLAVIVVGILGVLGYERYFGQDAQTTTEATNQQQTENPVQVESSDGNAEQENQQANLATNQQADNQQDNTQPRPNDAQSNQQTTPPVNQQNPPVSQTTSGHPLLGPGTFDLSQGGFTWIFTGRADRTAAQNIANGLRAQGAGYRVDIMEGVSGGAPYYRIGIGQFATRAEALQMKDQLPAIVPSDTWLFTIQ